MIIKKGQGMPLNAIVIAGLVLLVLIVIAVIFGTKIQSFGQGAETCTAKGGECSSGQGCIETQGEVKIGDSTTTDCTYECCIKTR
jgi:hypothetical protein